MKDVVGKQEEFMKFTGDEKMENASSIAFFVYLDRSELCDLLRWEVETTPLMVKISL